MTATLPSRAVALFGTEAADGAGRTLRAGALSAELDSGALRYIRVDGIEVLRAIAFIVRDENWGTFAPQIADLEVTESGDAFRVTYRATCGDGSRRIDTSAAISASARDGLTFEATATPATDFLTNRTGFVVLHPVKGIVGRPVTVEHVDGRIEESRFPEVIDPVQPFFDIRALTHEVQPGLRATCRMEGDTFEMEDHRNWTDASFKTYVRPLARPWPYTLPAGETFEQSVSLTFSASLPAAAATATGTAPVRITLGGPDGTMPRIGLGVLPDHAESAVAAADLARIAAPQLLICQLDGRRGDNAASAERYRRLGEATGAGIVLELIIPGDPAPGAVTAEVAALAGAVRAAGLSPEAIAISPAAHLKAILPGTPMPPIVGHAEMYAAARAAFPGVPLGGGQFSYFTELNRIRPPADLVDFVTHTTCPAVHAADDVSVMETLEAIPSVVHSTRQFIGGKPYWVGPSAIAARDNPYGRATTPNPGNTRVCLAEQDPRQRGLFGAAWTLGYASAFAAGGVAALSFGGITGPAGIVATPAPWPRPHFDHLDGPAVHPPFHVVRGLAGTAGRARLSVASSDDGAVVGLAHEAESGAVVWLANITAAPRRVELGGRSGPARLLVLDAAAFATLAADPAFLDGAGVPIGAGDPIDLDAYAVARLALS